MPKPRNEYPETVGVYPGQRYWSLGKRQPGSVIYVREDLAADVPQWVRDWIRGYITEHHWNAKGGFALDMEGREMEQWLNSLPPVREKEDGNTLSG